MAYALLQNTFLSTNSKRDSSKFSGCFMAGFGFVRTTQAYDLLDNNTIQPIKSNFYTNEFLLDLGGMAKLNLCEKIYVSFGGGLQIGADYTWSNNEVVGISKIVSIN